MERTTLSLDGAAGSKQTTIPLDGEVSFLSVDFTNGASEGTLSLTAPGVTLLDYTGNTDLAGPLMADAIGTDGGAVSGVAGAIPVSGYITATWASHNSNTAIEIEVWTR